MINIDLFDNYISLGWFCSVAIQLKQYGLRKFSSPFDWVLSTFSFVITLIDNNFEDFMLYDNLSQSSIDRNHYKDEKNDIYFFHDFNYIQPLKKQYNKVKDKYDRRILRFYEKIKNPTLFFRYIKDYDESLYICVNLNQINSIIKRFNEFNDIVYITDNIEIYNTMVKKVTIYYVKKGMDDTVNRYPFACSNDLLAFINKEKNSWRPKQDNIIKRLVNIITKRFSYKHYKTYE